MRKEIAGILFCMLVMATAVPAVGTLNKTINQKNIQTQSRGVEWNFTYGGGEFDDIRHIEQTTPDGGYIGCGLTEESNNYYVWLLKLDADGNEEWRVVNHDLNGTYVTTTDLDVFAPNIFQTSDGGFLISGCSVINITIEEENVWISTGFLWKTTATGTTEWMQHYYSIEELAVIGIYYTVEIQDGYISTGHRIYFDMAGQIVDLAGFLLKTDTDGNFEWLQSYNADDADYYDHLSALCRTTDGGFLLTGFTELSTVNAGLWMVKTNGAGVKEWEKIFNGPNWEYTYGKGCFQTSEGGYIMCGNTWSYGAGNADVWVIKTDALGNEIWNRTYGYTRNDYTWCMSNISTGGFVLAICKDYTYYTGTMDDIWIVELNEAGGTEWSYLIEEAGTQIPTCIRQTDDSGFIISGRTEEYGIAISDGLVVKIGPFPHLTFEITGGIGIKVIIDNSGLGDAPNILWQITVQGGILGMINKTVNGTIDVPAGDTVTVKTGLLLGFGPISIIAKVANEEQTAEGTQLVIFSIVK